MSARRIDLRSSEGFTLIEVLVAAIILVVGILGTTKLIAGSEAATVDSELQQVATAQGEKRIEAIRGLGYESIGHGSTAPTSAPAGAGSISGTSYDGEQLVATANESASQGGEPGDGAGAIAPVQTFSLNRGAGEAPVTGKIYTFVTWRDEECGALGLSGSVPLNDLQSQLGSLSSQLATATSQLDAMTTSINQTLTSTNSAITAITTTLIGLIPNYGTLKTNLQTLNSDLTTLRTKISDLKTAINALPVAGALTVLSKLDGVTDLDLCDVSAEAFAALSPLLDEDAGGVGDLAAALNTKLGTLSGTLTSLNLSGVRTAVGSVTTAIGSVASTISGAVCSNPLTRTACLNVLNPVLLTPLNNATSAVNSALGVFNGSSSPTTAITAISTDVAGLHDALLGITSDVDVAGLSRDTTHNTKRITVAVTVDSAGPNSGPQSPVWLSSVVSDPDAALLGAG